MDMAATPRLRHAAAGTRTWLRAGLLIAGLAVCGAAGALEQVKLQLKWSHQFQFAGYYAAVEQGYYREAGLDVQLLELPHGGDAANALLEGRAQYAVGTTRVLIERAAGKPLVVLASVFQHSPSVLLVKRGADGQPAELRGARVMIPASNLEMLVYLKRIGVDYAGLQQLPPSHDIGDISRGKVLAMAGYSTEAGFDVEHDHPDVAIVTPRAAGIDFYGDVLFTTEAELRAHPGRAAALRAASLRGWKYALAHPAEIVDLIRARYPQAPSRERLLLEARQLAPLLQSEVVELGYSNPDRWRDIAATYGELGLVPPGFKVEGLLYQAPGPDLRALYASLVLALLLLTVAALAAWRYARLSASLRRERAALRATEDRLSSAESMWSFVLEGSGDGVWEWQRGAPQLLLSARCEQLLGYAPGELHLTEANWLDQVHPEDQARMRAEMERFFTQRMADGQRTMTSEFRMKTREGGWCWVLTRGMLIAQDERGLPLRLSGTLADIGDRKEAEEARVRAVLEASSDAMLLVDTAGRIRYANQISARSFGYPLGALTDMPLERLVPELPAAALPQRPAAGISYAAILAHLPNRIVEACRVDGSVFPAEANMTPMQSLGQTLVIVSLRDVTERLRAEEALKASAERYRRIVQTAAEGIWMFDAVGNTAFVNPRLAEMLGYEADEMLGQPLAAFAAPEARAALSAHLDQSRLQHNRQADFQLLRKDGASLWAQISVSPIHADNGSYTGSLAMLTDISDRHAAEQALRELNEHLEERVQRRTKQLDLAKRVAEEASLAKGQFLANMSHEIRTPMNGVIGMAYLALKSDPNPRQRDYLEKIRFAGEHLLGIIDDILDFSKIEAGKLEIETVEFDLDHVIQTLTTVVAPKAATRELALVFELDPELPAALLGDPLRLGQILINYANNAIKFSERGEIVVRVRRVEADAEHCLLRFEVQDKGIGMTAEEMGKLFQSFQQADASTTREYGGTGLGLAICKQLAQLMGGEVGVDSTSGAGSCFWFTARLGVVDAGPAGANPGGRRRSVLPEHSPAVLAALRGARILLAEDNSFNQQIALELLEDAGAVVCVANNGLEALDLLRQAQFDCVLMDVQMPVMDGLEATRRIRTDARLAPTRVLAMTATATSDDRARCIGAGMDDFITKPIQPVSLLRTIANWLPDRRGAPAPTAAPAPASTPQFHALGGDPAVIDLSILAKLLSYNQDKVRKFAFKFLQSTQEGFGEIEAALKAGNIARVRELGHRIKSSARAVGALGMAEFCLQLETLPADTPEAEQAAVRAILDRLWPLLEAITEQIMTHTTYADD